MSLNLNHHVIVKKFLTKPFQSKTISERSSNWSIINITFWDHVRANICFSYFSLSRMDHLITICLIIFFVFLRWTRTWARHHVGRVVEWNIIKRGSFCLRFKFMKIYFRFYCSSHNFFILRWSRVLRQCFLLMNETFQPDDVQSSMQTLFIAFHNQINTKCSGKSFLARLRLSYEIFIFAAAINGNICRRIIYRHHLGQ